VVLTPRNICVPHGDPGILSDSSTEQTDVCSACHAAVPDLYGSVRTRGDSGAVHRTRFLGDQKYKQYIVSYKTKRRGTNTT
jgi:hypothetical protein